MFETLIEIVCAFEALRQRITNQKGMDTVIAFNSLDFDSDGKISSNDVSSQLINKNSSRGTLISQELSCRPSK